MSRRMMLGTSHINLDCHAGLYDIAAEKFGYIFYYEGSRFSPIWRVGTRIEMSIYSDNIYPSADVTSEFNASVNDTINRDRIIQFANALSVASSNAMTLTNAVYVNGGWCIEFTTHSYKKYVESKTINNITGNTYTDFIDYYY